MATARSIGFGPRGTQSKGRPLLLYPAEDERVAGSHRASWPFQAAQLSSFPSCARCSSTHRSFAPPQVVENPWTLFETSWVRGLTDAITRQYFSLGALVLATPKLRHGKR